jgi:flagellar motor protein MotB
MAKKKSQVEPEQQAGAPEWMVTFSDCMTLLLTFFVLLLSFSSFDDRDYFEKMSSSLMKQISFDTKDVYEKESLAIMQKLQQEVNWGSEKPTLSDKIEDRFKKQSKPLDFLKYKTFLIPSHEIFWGKGDAVSLNGKRVLTDFFSFVNELPGYYIILSESGPCNQKEKADALGLDRSWAVFHYLTNRKGLAQERVNISVVGTVAKECHSNQIQLEGFNSDDRILEIVLMKRDI